MEEVTTMELNTMLTRPSTSLIPACAPSALTLMPSTAVVAVPVLAAERAPDSRVQSARVISARVSAARVHQAEVQAELAQAQVRFDEINVSTGFLGLGLTAGKRIDSKRYADGGSGVPPRGRPVC
jgi:hypothetical protein